ncbi:MAG: SUMF1/EgtB/PvdO family nonheme iron enzyme [Pseudomonadota bacterium]
MGHLASNESGSMGNWAALALAVLALIGFGTGLGTQIIDGGTAPESQAQAGTLGTVADTPQTALERPNQQPAPRTVAEQVATPDPVPTPGREPAPLAAQAAAERISEMAPPPSAKPAAEPLPQAPEQTQLAPAKSPAKSPAGLQTAVAAPTLEFELGEALSITPILPETTARPPLAEPVIAEPQPTLAPETALAAASLRLAPDTSLRDCDVCPELVAIVPAPGQPAFAIGLTEVTIGQYTAYLSDIDALPGQGEGDRYLDRLRARDPLMPGFAQMGDHPATFISLVDAKRYAAWLSEKTGENYRLPTEAEWLHAARAGTARRFVWGDVILRPPCLFGNVADASTRGVIDIPGRLGCRDGHPTTAPVAAFRANGFGLYDMTGNVEEWVDICGGRPDCRSGAVIGGSWASNRDELRLADRRVERAGVRDNRIGLRLVRDL